jgi:hypothetical protein
MLFMSCVGAIVAIQDVHQHLYFAVEERENKYSLFGVIHHSLVGEKALFRVRIYYFTFPFNSGA